MHMHLNYSRHYTVCMPWMWLTAFFLSKRICEVSIFLQILLKTYNFINCGIKYEVDTSWIFLSVLHFRCFSFIKPYYTLEKISQQIYNKTTNCGCQKLIVKKWWQCIWDYGIAYWCLYILHITIYLIKWCNVNMPSHLNDQKLNSLYKI